MGKIKKLNQTFLCQNYFQVFNSFTDAGRRKNNDNVKKRDRGQPGPGGIISTIYSRYQYVESG